MTTCAPTIGHRTLALQQLSPARSAAFSPNLHRWMRHKGHFFSDGGVLQTAHRVKPGTAFAASWGAGTLMMGYASHDYPGDNDFIGIQLMAILCQGTAAGSGCFAGASDLEEVPGFWDRYLAVGRCAIDPAHEQHFLHNDRYSVAGEMRICLWCGAEHVRKLTPRTVFDTTWTAR